MATKKLLSGERSHIGAVGVARSPVRQMTLEQGRPLGCAHLSEKVSLLCRS
jgi:hypothetical protein